MTHFQDAMKGAFLSVILLVAVIITITTSLSRMPTHEELYDKNREDKKREFLEGHDLGGFLYHDQEDKELVGMLQSWMIPPAFNTPYNLRREDFETSQGQGRVVRKLTNYKTGGFFVECGSGDGEFFSNTLFLEKHLGWTGLLVEADPSNAADSLSLNRKAWVAPFCMSLNTSAYKTFFERRERADFLGKVLPEETGNALKIKCFPFYTYLRALNVKKVDYFSLDVEGHEVEVLETVPFDKVDITVLSVEFSKSRGGLLGVKKIMEEKGYKIVDEVAPDDLIFVKKTMSFQNERFSIRTNVLLLK